MGIDRYSYVVHGIKMSVHHTPKIKERMCDHPVTGGKFCPECGKPTWREIKIYLENDLEKIGLDFVPDHYDDAKYYFIGKKIACLDDSHRFIELPIVVDTDDRVMNDIINKFASVVGPNVPYEKGAWLINLISV